MEFPRSKRLLVFLALLLPTHGIRRSWEARDLNDGNRWLSQPHSSNTHNERTLYELPTSPEEHRVTDLPLLDPSDNDQLRHYAGHLPASSKDDKYFFYWMFHPPSSSSSSPPHGKDETSIPLVIWLNGGPGCSSMDGLFLEHGPIRFNSKNELTLNPFSWHTAPAYVMYVDQPVGTGLSFTKLKTYPKNDDQVNADFYYWLVQFLLLHKDTFLQESSNGSYTMKRPFYFSGESHAGHYIPSMMDYILKQNEQKASSVTIQLSGAAIGNGWTDPYNQYAAARAAFGHGMIGLAQVAALDEKEKECQRDLSRKRYRSSVCFELLDTVVDESQGKTAKNKISQYDARKWESKHGSRTFPPGHKVVESYLGGWKGEPVIATDVVLGALHASAASDFGQRYQECTDPPYNALSHQDGLGVVPEVINVLEHNITILFFNGLMDLICNHVGNEVFLDKMEWKHQEEWTLAPRYSWSAGSSNTPSGYMKEYRNLKFLKILNSGHMVPLDVPEVALDMMKTLMYGGSFDTNQQGLGTALPSEQCEPCPACDDTDTVPETKQGGEVSQPNPVTKYVIAHSWLGAVFAVVVFLAVLVWVRRRQAVETRAIRRLGSSASYELELKDQDTSRYRDDPESNGDDAEVQTELASHPII